MPTLHAENVQLFTRYMKDRLAQNIHRWPALRDFHCADKDFLNVMQQVSEWYQSGSTLSASLATQPTIFSQEYVEVIRNGEQSDADLLHAFKVLAAPYE